MIDLKPYFDAVNQTEAEVQRIAAELDTLYRQDSEEAKAEAVARKSELDEAMQKHEEAAAMYDAMQKANRPNDVARNFVPVSNTTTEPADSSQPSAIKRVDYERMPLVDRAKFIRSGGSVED